MIRADHYAEGTTVRIRPGHPYDTRWRIVGTVCLDGRGDLAFYGGEEPDGSKTAEVAAHWQVAEGEPPDDNPPEPWICEPWLIVDTETTGLTDPGIVELGAVVMHEGRVVEHRSAIYNPGKPIEPEAAAVHGITDDIVRDRPRIADPSPATGRTAAEGIALLAKSHGCKAIVGYNILHFDLPILRRELGEPWLGTERSIRLVADPLVVVRRDDVGRYWKGQGRHRLTAVAERLKLTAPEPGMADKAHRASWDCVLAGRILWRLREHVPADLTRMRSWQSKAAAQQKADLDAYFAKIRGTP